MQFDFFGELGEEVELLDLALFYLFDGGDEASLPMPCQVDHSELALPECWANLEAVDHFGRLQNLASAPRVSLFVGVVFDEV